MYEVWYGRGERPVSLKDQRTERTGVISCETEQDARQAERDTAVFDSPFLPPLWTRIVRRLPDGSYVGL